MPNSRKNEDALYYKHFNSKYVRLIVDEKDGHWWSVLDITHVLKLTTELLDMAPANQRRVANISAGSETLGSLQLISHNALIEVLSSCIDPSEFLGWVISQLKLDMLQTISKLPSFDLNTPCLLSEMAEED